MADNKKLNELIAETIMNDTAGQLKEIVAEKINEVEKNALKEIENLKQKMTDKLDDLEKTAKQVPVSYKVKTSKGETDKLVHSAFETVLQVLQSAKRINKNIMLVGQAGAGKNVLCQDVAEALELDYYPMSVGIQTTKSDLLGFINARGEYVTTPVRQAFENGGVLLLDEFDATHAGVVTILNSLLANDRCSFPDKIVEKNENFICIVACNTYGRGGSIDYIGRNKLDSATLDRFVVIDVNYDDKLEGLLTRNEDWLNIVRKMRDNAKKQGLKVIISPRASMQGADLLDAGFGFEDVLNMVIYKGLTDEVKTQLIKDVNFSVLTKKKKKPKDPNKITPIQVKLDFDNNTYSLRDIEEDMSISAHEEWNGNFSIFLSTTGGYSTFINNNQIFLNLGSGSLQIKDKSGSSKLIRELETYGDSVVVENQPVDIEITVDRQIKHIRLG